MGEKGMESPAPLRSGVAGAAEAVGSMAGVSNMAAGGTIGGAMAGSMQQAIGGGIGDAGSNETAKQDDDAMGQPPKG